MSKAKDLAGLVSTGGILSDGTVNLTSEVTGTLPIASGGTNATTADGALTALGGTSVGTSVFKAVDAAAARNAISAASTGANSDITSLTGLTTALSVAQGGTGLTSSGTSGNVLTSNGTGWTSSPVASGAMTLISTQTASSSASLSWSSGLTYDQYMIVFDNLNNTATAVDLAITFSGSTSNYQYAGLNVSSSGTIIQSASTSGSYGLLSVGQAAQTYTGGFCGVVNIYGALGNISGLTRYTCNSSHTENNSTAFRSASMIGGQTGSATNPLFSISIKFTSGNIFSGTASLYGISS